MHARTPVHTPGKKEKKKKKETENSTHCAAMLQPHRRNDCGVIMSMRDHELTSSPLTSCAVSSFCACVCPTPFQGAVTNLFRLFLFTCTAAGGSRVCSWREPTKLQVQTRISKEDALSTYLPMFQSLPSIHFKLVETFC